jgi:hypothetical protein
MLTRAIEVDLEKVTPMCGFLLDLFGLQGGVSHIKWQVQIP